MAVAWMRVGGGGGGKRLDPGGTLRGNTTGYGIRCGCRGGGASRPKQEGQATVRRVTA